MREKNKIFHRTIFSQLFKFSQCFDWLTSTEVNPDVYGDTLSVATPSSASSLSSGSDGLRARPRRCRPRLPPPPPNFTARKLKIYPLPAMLEAMVKQTAVSLTRAHEVR